jgi:hypothetical protein
MSDRLVRRLSAPFTVQRVQAHGSFAARRLGTARGDVAHAASRHPYRCADLGERHVCLIAEVRYAALPSDHATKITP